MNLLDYIDLKAFILSFSLGLFIVYCSTSKPTIVIKYPTPENSDSTIFKDDVDNCYKFNTREVKCPKGETVQGIPIQKTLEHFKKNSK